MDKEEKEVRYLSNLKEGAKLCLANSERLLDDAKTLYERKSYLSCFLLSQLCLEEIAKGLMLIEKEDKKERFSENDWEDITKGSAHHRKIKYRLELEKRESEEFIKKYVESPETKIKSIYEHMCAIADVKNIEEYLRKQVKSLYDYRKHCLYVHYDFYKKQWIDPLRYSMEGYVLTVECMCNIAISQAKELLKSLKETL